MFVLSSDNTVGNFRFSGVHEVRINHSLHSAVVTAIIKIPTIAKIIKSGSGNPEKVITGNQFKEGDPVTIKLGYNNDLQTEFKGFVKRRNMDMPLEIECEGYSWLLRRNTVNISRQSISVKELLELAIKGINSGYTITIDCNLEMELCNIQVNGTGMDVINAISKYTDACVTCCFTEPDILWCGLLYTPVGHGQKVFDSGSVEYRLGFNTPRENTLKQRITTDDPVEVKYSKKLSRGTRLSEVSNAFKKFARTHSRILNQLKSALDLKRLANEKAYKMNYAGYEGNLHTFLQPYAAPGYQAFIKDTNYPERDGTYIIESVETHFGINGARRIVEIGPMVGFANTL